MKYVMWALASLFLLAACSNSDGFTGEKNATASAKLLNLQEYQQENSFAFECNTTGFTPHTFEWDFGDGTTRTTPYKGVAHTYFKSGTYTVTCTAADDLMNETSKTVVTVDIEGQEEYMPENTSIFDDLGLVDLLSDVPEPYLSSNATPNTSIRASPVQYDDDYDFNFDFDEEEIEESEEEENDTSNPDGQGTITNTTQRNNTTPRNTTNTTNTTIDPHTTQPNATQPNTTNVTPTIPPIVIPPINQTDPKDEKKGEKKKDHDDVNESDDVKEPEDTEENDIEAIVDEPTIDIEIDSSVSKGKIKKMLIADLKFRK